MGSGIGDAFVTLAYLAVFGVAFVVVAGIMAVLSIWWPIPVWAVYLAAGVVAVMTSAIVVGSQK